MGELKPQDQAPDFCLLDQRGLPTPLAEFKGRKLFLYFYPKADTPGCTVQACAIRDGLCVLSAHGVQVVAISPDRPEELHRFDEKFSLGFKLLSDEEHAVAKAYGVWGEKMSQGKMTTGILRSAFILNEEGAILRAWYRIKPDETLSLLLDYFNEPA